MACRAGTGQRCFAKQQRLSQRPLDEWPAATLPKRLRPYLLTFDADGKPTGLHADRYEFWLYRQIRKRLQSGELYLDDSLQHRHFSDELVEMDRKIDVLAKMEIPFLQQPVHAQLDALTAELRTQWLAFNRELKQGKLTHLEYNKDTQKLTGASPRARMRKRAKRHSTRSFRSATWPTCFASSTTSASFCRRSRPCSRATRRRSPTLTA